VGKVRSGNFGGFEVGCQTMKIALVHDDLIQRGGAERLFLAMIEVFPGADVFVSMVSDHWETQNSKLKTSFMQRLPFKEKLYRHYFMFYPLAFESFDFAGYDVVLSSSTRFAHGVITRPETLHICYMNTPPRMFWEPFEYFEESPALRLFISPFLSWLRVWDRTAAQRPDVLIANSKTPQARIKKYYGRDSNIIYPFVDLERFRIHPNENSPLDYSNLNTFGYFLVVSRLTSWKKIDIAIEACNQLKLPLKIIGEGHDLPRLKKLAGPNIEFLGRLTDKEVVRYYKNCRALIFPQKEDFGITPLEAMAAGKSVIAFKAGGALETVIEGKTGEFFYPQTTSALVEVLKHYDTVQYHSENCRAQAERFGKERFQRELKSFVEESYEEHTRLL
jgi:glycosyltransferase involved in cell wall biosynthesis